jgi:predicted 2-oxoglutarate/Fe(II)-dependent dioxygenase YbiX/peroxiredoxin
VDSLRPSEPAGDRGVGRPLRRARLIDALGGLGLALGVAVVASFEAPWLASTSPLSLALGGCAWVLGRRDVSAMAAGRLPPVGLERTCRGIDDGKRAVALALAGGVLGLVRWATTGGCRARGVGHGRLCRQLTGGRPVPKALLSPGDAAPWFTARSTTRPDFHFDQAAGRYVVLCFFGSAADPLSRAVLDGLLRRRARFDDESYCFFGVSTDPDDERLGRVQESLPGLRYFWDADGRVSRLYGALPEGAGLPDAIAYRRFTVVLDERLRVLALDPFGDDPAAHVARLIAYLDGLPPFAPEVPAAIRAPVLVVPRVFEPELCRELIAFYDRHGGAGSGFMREVDGRTVGVVDYAHKRRRDQEITDERLRNAAMYRVHDRLAPQIERAFQFQATRIERHIVACYDAATGGHFRPHRDNTTKGTAHRRFAVSLNLNTGAYAGGDLRFPEFGRQTYCAPAGGAVVFSCSLLHEATPVTRGRRYAYLPFLYDEAAARVREQNVPFVAGPTPPPEKA